MSGKDKALLCPRLIFRISFSSLDLVSIKCGYISSYQYHSSKYSLFQCRLPYQEVLMNHFQCHCRNWGARSIILEYFSRQVIRISNKILKILNIIPGQLVQGRAVLPVPRDASGQHQLSRGAEEPGGSHHQLWDGQRALLEQWN